MNWFKSIWLTSKERQILREAKEKEKVGTVDTNIPTAIHEIAIHAKPYSKLIYFNGIITVIFHGGEVISKVAEADVFKQIQELTTYEEIQELLLGKKDEVVFTQLVEQKEHELVKNAFPILESNDAFIINGDDVYMKGINLKIPDPVLFSFIEILEKLEEEEEYSTSWDELKNQYNALKMFWLWLALNPIEQSRKDLLVFVKKNDVRITGNGNLVLYRRIVSVGEENKELTTFVCLRYYDRKKQKKAETHPRNYSVIRKNGTLNIVKQIDIEEDMVELGNLNDMFKNLDKLDENTYTSWHNQGHEMIRVGSIYKIKDNEINLNNGLCAAGGLHAAAVNYDYGGYGDTPVVVLVNPSKAITVPTNETGKLRTVEMFVACINDKRHGHHFDEDALTGYDEEYHNMSMEQLEDAISKKDFSTINIQDKKIPVILYSDIVTIKDMLKDRIKEVV